MIGSGGGESGQALILALGGAFVLLAGALALVAIAGAVTGKGRLQRAADLAAISAARSMRDDLPKLLSPSTLANGLPNPAHLDKPAYLARARLAAVEAGRTNGVDPDRLELSFPDTSSFAPVRARANVVARLELGTDHGEVEASAVAEAAAPVGAAAGPSTMASGGGYSGPLVYRTGEGMRPDAAAAFDRMAAAARGAGISLLVVSGFRSDAEQAALFAAHPDPTWVAPPGHSLHRCATVTPAASGSFRGTRGRPGITASTPARRPVRRPATRWAGRGEERRQPRAARPCRASSPAASVIR
jgi:D-alanyl-D-alanine carboxypeptidase/Putative Flp pilus-assembly TadE/G-like